MYVRQLDEKVLRLLEALQKHPELYAPSNRTARYTRQKLWDYIARNTGFAKTEDAKSRWRGLILYFRQHLEDVAKKKYRRYIPNTDNPDDRFVQLSDWRYYEYIKFMEPYMSVPAGLPDPRSTASVSKVGITKNDQSKAPLQPPSEISSAVQNQKFAPLKSPPSSIVVQNQTVPILFTPQVGLAKTSTVIQEETNLSTPNRSPATLLDHARRTTPVAQSSSLKRPATPTTPKDLQHKMKIRNVIFDIQYNEETKQGNVCMKQQHAATNTTTLPVEESTPLPVAASTTKFEDLSENDQNLKRFFDALFKSTQGLPAYHQECVQTKLLKAVRNI